MVREIPSRLVDLSTPLSLRSSRGSWHGPPITKLPISRLSPKLHLIVQRSHNKRLFWVGIRAVANVCVVLSAKKI